MPLWSRRIELNTPWDMGLIERTPMDSRKFQEEYMGNFNDIPVPVKDAPAGKRIDEAVVKALGWRINYWEDETDGGYEVFDTKGKRVGSWNGDDPKFHWSPSNSLLAAWELVEANYELGLLVHIGNAILYTCKFGAAFGESNYIAMADTAPLAITRAFLLSRGVQEI